MNLYKDFYLIETHLSGERMKPMAIDEDEDWEDEDTEDDEWGDEEEDEE